LKSSPSASYHPIGVSVHSNVGALVVEGVFVGISELVVEGKLVGEGVCEDPSPPPHTQHAMFAVTPFSSAQQSPNTSQFDPSAYHVQLKSSPSASYHPIGVSVHSNDGAGLGVGGAV
jgi:hypothetical protein